MLRLIFAYVWSTHSFTRPHLEVWVAENRPLRNATSSHFLGVIRYILRPLITYINVYTCILEDRISVKQMWKDGHSGHAETLRYHQSFLFDTCNKHIFAQRDPHIADLQRRTPGGYSIHSIYVYYGAQSTVINSYPFRLSNL